MQHRCEWGTSLWAYLHSTISAAIEDTQNSIASSSSRPQVRFMQKLLKHVNVEAMTVDGSQGREWDHVFLSLVRTERDGTFVNDPRRQCVAMSRAKLSMILVAHPALAAALPHLRRFWDHATTYELLARPTTVQARPPRHVPSATRHQAEPASAHEQEDSRTAYLEARLQKLKPDSTMGQRWSSTVRVIENALVRAPGDDEPHFWQSSLPAHTPQARTCAASQTSTLSSPSEALSHTSRSHILRLFSVCYALRTSILIRRRWEPRVSSSR